MDKPSEDGPIEDRPTADGQTVDKQIEDRPIEDGPNEEEILESALAESLIELVPDNHAVSDDAFIEVVAGALEAVSGMLLFRMRTEINGQEQHVAAASLGEGDNRQFLLLTLPASGGGALKVEPISKSANPVAGIAAAYAGLMDAFQAAA